MLLVLHTKSLTWKQVIVKYGRFAN